MASSNRLHYRLSITFVALAVAFLGMIVIQAQQEQGFLGVRTVVNELGTQVVDVVSGSPAEAAGFRAGDIIVSINGQRVSSSTPLETILGGFQPGALLQVTITREGTQETLVATLGARSGLQTAEATGAAAATESAATESVTGTPIPPDVPTSVVVTAIPVTVAPALPAGQAGFLGVRLTSAPSGARVTAVLPRSPAEASGIRVGDVIVGIDNVAITSAAQLQQILASRPVGAEVTLRIRRGDTLTVAVVRLGAQPVEAATVEPSFPTPTPGPAQAGITAFFPTLGMRVSFEQTGLRVTDVLPNSAAARGLVQPGDIISAVDGLRYNIRDVTPVVSRLVISPRPRLTILRGGQTVTVQLIPTLVTSPTPVLRGGRLGVVYDVVTPALVNARGLTVDHGAFILEVTPNSPADFAGIKQGDVITAVDGDRVDAKRTLALRMAAYTQGDSVTLTVVRGSETLHIAVTLAARGVAQTPAEGTSV
jgi:S1-C subfamily serine protease